MKEPQSLDSCVNDKVIQNSLFKLLVLEGDQLHIPRPVTVIGQRILGLPLREDSELGLHDTLYVLFAISVREYKHILDQDIKEIQGLQGATPLTAQAALATYKRLLIHHKSYVPVFAPSSMEGAQILRAPHAEFDAYRNKGIANYRERLELLDQGIMQER